MSIEVLHKTTYMRVLVSGSIKLHNIDRAAHDLKCSFVHRDSRGDYHNRIVPIASFTYIF